MWSDNQNSRRGDIKLSHSILNVTMYPRKKNNTQKRYRQGKIRTKNLGIIYLYHTVNCSECSKKFIGVVLKYYKKRKIRKKL